MRATGTSASSRVIASDVAANLPGSGAGGAIEVRVSPRPAGEWSLTARYRLVLRASDPLVDWLRVDPRRIQQVVDVLPGGYATTEIARAFDGSEVGAPSWCSLAQQPGSGEVTVTADHTTTLPALTDGSYLPYSLGEDVQDSNGEVVPHPPGTWSWSMEVPASWGFMINGRPELQSAHAVRITLPREHSAASVQAVFHVRSAEDWNDGVDAVLGIKAAISLLAVLASVAAVLLGLVREGAAAARQPVLTRSVTVGAALLVAPVLGVVTWDLSVDRWDQLYWIQDSGWHSVTELSAEGVLIETQVQGVLLGVFLFSLPLLATCVLRAARGIGPPPTRHVIVLTLPAFCLLVTAWLMGGGRWSGAVALCCAAASVAAGAVLLAPRLHPAFAAVRPWTPAVAAAAWATVAATIVLDVVPAQFWTPEVAADPPTALHHRAAIATWLLLYLLLTPLVTAPLLLVGGLPGLRLRALARLPRGARAALVPGFVTALLPWWTGTDSTYYTHPRSISVIAQLTGQIPGADYTTGIDVLAPTLQVVWAAAAVLLLAQLYNSGGSPGRWGSSARAGCVALMLLATAAPFAGSPKGWLPHATSVAALAAVWCGSLVLLPPERRAEATRLHALSGAAHARLVNSLARVLLFSESRHRFLSASRGTLADASASPQDWERTWQSLRSPTGSDAARDTARLRATALGSSGGRSAWSNGLAGAVTAGLLTLPWTAWPAWHGLGLSGLPEAVTIAGGTTCVWLAHGFVYGYLYPWLRGRGPMAKAGWLWAVMSPVQILLLWPRLRLPFDQTALSVTLLLAQSTVLALGLALFWEVRLVRRADLLWGHVRNLRRLSSLAAPLSAVLVAAIAAAVTVLASAWAGDLTSPEVPPTPATSPAVPGEP
jgi:hypothetical protein